MVSWAETGYYVQTVDFNERLRRWHTVDDYMETGVLVDCQWMAQAADGCAGGGSSVCMSLVNEDCNP